MAKGGDEAEGSEGGDDGLDMSTMLESMKYKYSFKFAKPLGATTAAPGVMVEAHGTKQVAVSTDFGAISRIRRRSTAHSFGPVTAMDHLLETAIRIAAKVHKGQVTGSRSLTYCM